MKKLLLNTLVLASVAGVAACASTAGTADRDETLTQAPYSESRTIGDAPAPVESADAVFENKQMK